MQSGDTFVHQPQAEVVGIEFLVWQLALWFDQDKKKHLVYFLPQQRMCAGTIAETMEHTLTEHFIRNIILILGMASENSLNSS